MTFIILSILKDSQLDKIDYEENGIFWIKDGEYNQWWRNRVPKEIVDKIKEQNKDQR